MTIRECRYAYAARSVAARPDVYSLTARMRQWPQTSIRGEIEILSFSYSICSLIRLTIPKGNQRLHTIQALTWKPSVKLFHTYFLCLFFSGIPLLFSGFLCQTPQPETNQKDYCLICQQKPREAARTQSVLMPLLSLPHLSSRNFYKYSNCCHLSSKPPYLTKYKYQSINADTSKGGDMTT